MNHHNLIVMPRRNLPLPPREERSLADRVRAANVNWANLMLDINSSKSPLTGAIVWNDLKQIFDNLIHDAALVERIAQYFETAILTEGHKPGGRLL